MEYSESRHIGDILKARERNIEIIGADLATRHGFTQVPNFILTNPKLSVGAKLAYAMLLKYAWQVGPRRAGHQTTYHHDLVARVISGSVELNCGRELVEDLAQ